AGVSNGEEIVVRAAMKPLPTLMRPLRSVDLETGEPAEALVERSDTAAVEALAVVAEAAVAFELARAAREKFGGDALGDFVAAYNAYRERIDWTPRSRSTSHWSASWAPVRPRPAGSWRNGSAAASSTSTTSSRTPPGRRSPRSSARKGRPGFAGARRRPRCSCRIATPGWLRSAEGQFSR